MDNCQYCGKPTPKENMFYGFIAMCPPIPAMEERINKWGRDWFKNLERTDLTEAESKDLDDINLYDQLLSTVGRGCICLECLENEEKLLEELRSEGCLKCEEKKDII
jgi:hypothetical protein